MGKRRRTASQEQESLPAPSPMAGAEGEIACARVLFSMASHIGMVREVNEDSAFAWLQHISTHEGMQTVGLFMVADGMGGHLRGETASRLAVQTASESLLRQVVLPLLNSSGAAPPVPIQEAIAEAFQAAHQRLQEEVPEGATTLTIMLLVGKRIYVGHAGDCRLYLLRDGELRQMTRDHSLLHRLFELGQIDAEELEALDQDARRNALYRAVGQPHPLEIDLASHGLLAGDGLVLCSDGLWGSVSRADMTAILQQAATPADACRALVEAANSQGGPDNITVIVVRPAG
ncbi:MAG: PP2C family protein-serine/threonine phosphatase [Anaerolineae bacterium]